mmetsp:Transcript_39296/g.82248  ORF Transcript_39296/g.82248 Transcript_39296/m.82248 type:complete len:81 (+) Transcript_39296:1245-1487(+)
MVAKHFVVLRKQLHPFVYYKSNMIVVFSPKATSIRLRDDDEAKWFFRHSVSIAAGRLSDVHHASCGLVRSIQQNHNYYSS